MRRSLSRVSIRSIRESFCRYKSFEKGQKDVPERKGYFRNFVDSQGFSNFRSDAELVASLPHRIVNALQSGERDKASNFLSVLSSENVPLRADDFVYILDYCARSPDPLFVMETWRIMEEKEIGVSRRGYMYIIQALLGGGYIEEAFNCLSFLAQCPHNLPDLAMYNAFLIGCARTGSMVYADSCLDLMENQMVGKSEITYMALLKLAVVQKNLLAVQEIWKQFNKNYSPNMFVLQTFIKAFTSLGDLVSACEALELAVAQALRQNAFAWGSVKEMFQRPTLDIPVPSVSDFPSKSCSLTIVDKGKRCSISTTVDGSSAAFEGNTRECYRDMFSVTHGVLYDMVKNPCRTSVDTDTECRSVALVPVANQDISFGLCRELENGVFEMLNKGIEALPAKNGLRQYEPSKKKKFLKQSNQYMAKLFNIVIHACALAENSELAEQLFVQMQKLGLEQSNSTYEGLIKALIYTRGEQRGVTEGLKLLKVMEAASLRPSESILGILSIACSKISELDLAEALLDPIVESPWLSPFNALLAAYDVMDKPERAVRLLAKMKQLKLKSDIRTYELLFSLFGTVHAPYEKYDIKSNEIAAKRIKAIELDMMRNGVQHSVLSMRNLLKAFGEEGIGLKLIQYLVMGRHKFIPTNPYQGTIIYDTALHSLVEASQLRCAFNTFKDMRTRNFPLDAVTYDIMIQWCSLVKCFKSACVFVSLMLRDGFLLSTFTYTNLIKILVANNAFDEALHLLYQMTLEGIERCVMLYNTILLKAFLKSRFDIIEFIVEQMHREKVQPNPDTCSHVFRAYAERGFNNTAMEALQVLSMRMISEEENFLEKHSTYFEEYIIFAEGPKAELRIIEILVNLGEYLASALMNLRLCAISGSSICWSPNQSEWAKQISFDYDLKSHTVKSPVRAQKGCKGISRPAARVSRPGYQFKMRIIEGSCVQATTL